MATGTTSLDPEVKRQIDTFIYLQRLSDVARATAFFDSPALAAHMAKNAGVVAPPERHFWKA